jgi:hypothetical protein
MYYDVQVKLTQGWFTVWYDLDYFAAVKACDSLWSWQQTRKVRHSATV